MSIRRNTQLRVSENYVYYKCNILYLNIVWVTSCCISNAKVDKVKNHHFAHWLGDDPLTGLWLGGHPWVVRWMDSAFSRQGASTSCQETPRISSCDEWFWQTHNIISIKYYYITIIRRKPHLKSCLLIASTVVQPARIKNILKRTYYCVA